MDDKTLFKKLLWFVILRLPYYSTVYLVKILDYGKYPFLIEYYACGVVRFFRNIVIYPFVFFVFFNALFFFSPWARGFSIQTNIIISIILVVWYVVMSVGCFFYLFFTHKKYDLSPESRYIEPTTPTYIETPSFSDEAPKAPLTFAEQVKKELALEKMSSKELFNRLLRVQLVFSIKNLPLMRVSWGRIKHETHPYIKEEYASVMYPMHYFLSSLICIGLFVLLFQFELNQLPVFIITVLAILPIPASTFLASIPCLLYLYFAHKKYLS